MAYATTSDLSTRYRLNNLLDLVTDDGVRPVTIDGDPKAEAALDDASGIINSAVLLGERYEVITLTTLTGVDAAYLKRLTCTIAYSLLLRRVGKVDVDDKEIAWAENVLEQLRHGDRVFNVEANVEAGLEQSSFPSFTDYSSVNLLRDACPRLYPVRRKQSLPPN